jgi:MFS family permease
VRRSDEPDFARLYLHLFASAACVLPVASYVLTSFGWRPGDIGVGTAALALAGTLSSPAWGRLDDRTSWAPRAAVLSTSVAAVATGLTLGRLPHAATWAGLALFGAAEGPLDALLTTRVLSSRRHAGRLGSVRAFGSLGWVVGLALAAAVLTLWPDHAEWVLFAAALAAVSAPRSWGSRELSTRTGPPAGRRLWEGVPVRPVLGVMAFTAGTSFAISAVVQFTAGWAHRELAAGPFLALTPIALSAALELPAFTWVDRLARGSSPLVLVVLAGPPIALATFALAAFPSSVVMLGVQPLIGLTFALLFVGQSRMLAEAVPPDRQSSAQTLGSALSTGCAGLLAGTLGGQLADAVGYRGLFAALGVVSLAGTVPGVLRLSLRARVRVR